jgi:hypothetical protein
MTVMKLLGVGASAAMLVSASVAPATAVQSRPSDVVTCHINPDYPHWSRDGKSVIYKTRATCDNGWAYVTVYGNLYEGPLIGPGVRVASSKQSQLVFTGSTTTYYTPREDSTTKVACNPRAHYWGSSYATVPNGNSYASSTRHILITCP